MEVYSEADKPVPALAENAAIQASLRRPDTVDFQSGMTPFGPALPQPSHTRVIIDVQGMKSIALVPMTPMQAQAAGLTLCRRTSIHASPFDCASFQSQAVVPHEEGAEDEEEAERQRQAALSLGSFTELREGYGV